MSEDGVDPRANMDETELSNAPRDPWLLPAFLGVARLPISSLNFEHDLFKQHRQVSEKVVDRLRVTFQREGCLRSQSQNWIDALVDPRRLRSTLARNGLTQNELRPEAEELPLLELGPVDCLQGIHRILAASDVLNQNDQWWPVRLYCPETLPETTSLRIIEGALNEQPHSDGEIFRKIRIYHKEGNKKGEDKWWARLTPTKRKDLKQLLKNPQFAKAFDDLVDMPGLWHSIKLGTLHRLLTLRCDEELLRYLRHIYRTWKDILRSAKVALEAVDRDTVEMLELRAPGTSESDRDLIHDYVNSKKVFQRVTHESARKSILHALTSLPGLIPSLRSFFENLKYLEPCSNILRKLLGVKDKKTIYQSLSGAYFAPNSHVVEYAERRRRIAYTGSGDENGLWLSYVQLWAFCLRHFPSMTQLAPRKELKKDKPSLRSNAALWHYFGDLAINLGFRTEQAEKFKQLDPYRSLAEQFFKSQADSLPDSRVVSRMALVLKQADKGPAEVKTPRLTDDKNYLSRDRRCGRPFDDDFTDDINSLFIPLIYGSEPCQGHDISPFFVKKDIFLSFLGNKYAMSSDDVTMSDDGVDPGEDVHIPGEDIHMAEDNINLGPPEAEQLNTELESMRQQNSQLIAQLDSVHRENSALKEERNSLGARQRELESARLEISTQLQAKEQEYLQEKENAKLMQKEIEVLRNEVAIAEGDHHAADIINNYPLDIATTELEERLCHLGTELKAAIYARDQNARELSELKSKFEHSQAQIAGLESALADANRRIEELTKELEASNNDKETLQQAADQQILGLQKQNLAQTKRLEESQAEATANLLVRQQQIDELQQKLANPGGDSYTSQLQRSPSPDTSEALRRLDMRNRRLKKKLSVRESQAGIFGMLQASLENFSAGRKRVGSFEIMTPTAVISIDIPESEYTGRVLGTQNDNSPVQDPAGGSEERGVEINLTYACIDQVLNAIVEASKTEPWELYFKLLKVDSSQWKAKYIKQAMDQHGMCIAGPKSLLSSTKATIGLAGSLLPVDDQSGMADKRAENVIRVVESMRCWIGRTYWDGKRRRHEIEVNEAGSEQSKDTKQPPESNSQGGQSLGLVRHGKRAMIEGDMPSRDRGKPSIDQGGTGQEGQSLALVPYRQGTN